MKVCICCNILKSKEEFIKDKSRYDGLYIYCKSCNKERRKIFRENNKDKIKIQKKLYYEINKEEISNRKRIKYKFNSNNKEFLKRKNIKSSIWKKNNKGKVNKDTAKRRALKLKASYDWGELNSLIIEEAYDLAVLRENLTGIKWEVDHIIPLRNPLVCGLHVGINLQVIPSIENKIKSNKFHI